MHPDIEKIINSKKNLEQILDHLKDGILAHDIKRQIFFFNQAAEKITGYKREEVLNQDCHTVFGEAFCGGHCSFNNDKSNLHQKKEYNLSLISKHGELKNVEITLIPMMDEDDQTTGVIAAIKDLTKIEYLKKRANELTSFSNIIGQNYNMLQIFEQIRDVATYDYPVHIYGETGTGKELVAQAIHNESRRAGAPFVPINCGALPENLIESELFGHVKGAFSGAIRDKKGRFELADTGTIFLDEVAELSTHLQVKILRLLQEGTFEKVGGEQTIKVNVRIISATNKELKAELQKNTFRKDLYYRINVVPINLPPLRDRKNDIPLLAEHFLKQIIEKYENKPLELSQEALSLLMDYPWPGNVRELQNAIQFSFVKCKTKKILPKDLPIELIELDEKLNLRGPNQKLDLETVTAILQKTDGNKAKAAKLLGVGRATLYRFLNAHPNIHISS